MKKMKNSTATLLVIILFLFTGCGIFSLHPLYHEADLVFRQELIGTWQDANDKKAFLTIEPAADNKYKFLLADNEDSLIFEMGLLKLNHQYFIDLFPTDDCSLYGSGDCNSLEMLFKNYIPVHSFMKIDFEGQQIRLTEFDEDRLEKLFKQNRVRLAHEIVDDDLVIITASTNDLQKFMSRYGNDQEAFEEPSLYEKMP